MQPTMFKGLPLRGVKTLVFLILVFRPAGAGLYFE
jgi:hypothetical protein